MATSIKFDSAEIVSTTYSPQYVKHETNPDRILTSLQLAREDGEVLIADKWGIKKITLKGILTGTSQADLESKINTFKELFSREEKNLDIDWNSATLRYVATCTSHAFDRDHFNILFVPWTAEFTILSGEGKDTSSTLALNQASPDSGSNPYLNALTISGGKAPKPKITVNVSGSWGTGVLGIEVKDTDTGEKIQFTKNVSWASNSSVIIDCLLKKLTSDIENAGTYLEYVFYGIFMKFKIGVNNISTKIGGLTNQQSSTSETGGTGRLMDTTAKYQAESFSVPYTDTTFQGVELVIDKTGTPGTMTIRIETDSGNKPSGVLADANATFSLSPGSVGGLGAYTKVFSTNPFTLNANTKYWIVVKAAATLDGSNNYTIYRPGSIEYPKGKGMASTDSGGTWADFSPASNLHFKILFGGKEATASLLTTVEYTKTYL